jgi:hypothetical protein
MTRDFSLYCEHSIQPFVVYGINTPSYSTNMLGIRASKKPRMLSGRAMIISAGLQTPCTTSAEHNINISIHGIRYKYGNVASHFVENAISALTSPKERVVVIWRKENTEYPGPIDATRNAGLDVKETESGIICIGLGSALNKVRWLKNNATRSFYIIASKEPLLSLEKALFDYVSYKQGSSYELLVSFWDKVEEAAIDALSEAEGLSLIAGLGGPDGSHAFINSTNSDITAIEGIFSGIATDIGIPLYVIESNEENHFGLFKPRYWDWHPVPQSWRRVVP